MSKTKMRSGWNVLGAFNTLLPIFTSSPRFCTKRTPSWTYLRRTRKVFTRGNTVCNIRSNISARNLPPRTHTISPSIGPQKINRSEPFLQIQIAGRGNHRAGLFLAILFLASLCPTFENFSVSTTKRSSPRIGDPLSKQEIRFPWSREKESPSLTCDRSSFSEFSVAGWQWRNKEIRTGKSIDDESSYETLETDYLYW